MNRIAVLAAALLLGVTAACSDADDPSTTTPDSAAEAPGGDAPGGDGAVGAEEEPTAEPAAPLDPVDVCALLDEADWKPVLGAEEERRDATNNATATGALGQCLIANGTANVSATIGPRENYLLNTGMMSGEKSDAGVGDESTAAVFEDLTTIAFTAGPYAMVISSLETPTGLPELTGLAERLVPLLDS